MSFFKKSDLMNKINFLLNKKPPLKFKKRLLIVLDTQKIIRSLFFDDKPHYHL